MESNVITLKSSDDKTFQITITAVKKSNLFNDILDDYISETVFPLPDVNGQTLEKIIKYSFKTCEVYKEQHANEIKFQRNT